MKEKVSVVGGVADGGAPMADSFEDAGGEGMNDIDKVPLKRTTETANATGITATNGFG